MARPAADFGVAGRGEQRHAGAARAARDDRRGHVEVGQQPGERVGLHGGLRRALEAHVGLAAVGAVPDQHLVAVLGQGLGQLAHTR